MLHAEGSSVDCVRLCAIRSQFQILNMCRFAYFVRGGERLVIFILSVCVCVSVLVCLGVFFHVFFPRQGRRREIYI